MKGPKPELSSATIICIVEVSWKKIFGELEAGLKVPVTRRITGGQSRHGARLPDRSVSCFIKRMHIVPSVSASSRRISNN